MVNSYINLFFVEIFIFIWKNVLINRTGFQILLLRLAYMRSEKTPTRHHDRDEIGLPGIREFYWRAAPCNCCRFVAEIPPSPGQTKIIYLIFTHRYTSTSRISNICRTTWTPGAILSGFVTINIRLSGPIQFGKTVYWCITYNTVTQ